ncbi:hypothetical protein PybrP1_003420 [[Pythium] brassicae (nom. inval.)]|nr:hypothetical protein PybrP1_003420 [[Pythium] brassicae (nom. inval.)]
MSDESPAAAATHTAAAADVDAKADAKEGTSTDEGTGAGPSRKTKQGVGKRLNDKQRVEIIQIAENSKVSKRQLADKYGVSEAAIRKLLLKKDEFLKRYYDSPEAVRGQRLRGRNSGIGTDGDAPHAATAAASSGATGSANGSVKSASAGAARAPAHAHHGPAKSLYPSDDPWKHGLHALGGKIAPFLSSFARGRGGDAVDWIAFSRMLRDVRRAFHRYPELGFREVRTQAFIRRFCENTLRIPASNVQALAGTGLIVDVCFENRAVDKGAAAARKLPVLPVLAFRADMDAMPVEELNDHLPYCSTAKGQRKEQRKRKKRRVAGKAADDAAAPTGGGGGGATAQDDKAATATAAAAESVDGDMDAVSPAVDGEAGDAGDATAAAAHLSGHDGHMVIVLGLCALLVRNAHRLPPDACVRFIFQPAEVGPGGAQRMIQDGALAGVDEVYGVQNYPFPLYSVHVRPGPVMAHEVLFTIDIEGVGGHGSAPQQCVDPILAGAMVVQALQTIVSRSLSPTDTAVVSVTQFRGGETNNVIPSQAYLVGTIRDFDLAVAEKIKERMTAIVHATCSAVGATGHVTFADGYAPVINPLDETRAVQQAALAMGLSVSEQGLPLMAAEDFAYYLQERKGCFFFLGTKGDADDDKVRALHSDQYDFNDKALPLGIRLFLGILQARFACALYSAEEMQAFQLAMERLSLPSSVSIV